MAEKEKLVCPLVEKLVPTPTKQSATFALGWFWHPQEKFCDMEGVIDTIVGYTGGTTKNPTYESLGDHT